MSRRQKRERSRSNSPKPEKTSSRKKTSQSYKKNELVEVKESLNPNFGLGLFARKTFKRNYFIADMGGKFLFRSTYNKLPKEKKGRAIVWSGEQAATIAETTQYSDGEELMIVISNLIHMSNELIDQKQMNDDILDWETYDQSFDEMKEMQIKSIDKDEVDQLYKYLFLLCAYLGSMDLFLDTSETDSFAKYANDPTGDSKKRKPNANMWMSPFLCKFDLHASKLIKPGEEILINYGSDYFEME